MLIIIQSVEVKVKVVNTHKKCPGIGHNKPKNGPGDIYEVSRNLLVVGEVQPNTTLLSAVYGYIGGL